MKTINEIKIALENRKDRSAWNKGVTLYALELVENLEEYAEYNGHEPENAAELKEAMLNGAEDWKQFSWGGSALCYDCNIAHRLCNPSELKKTDGGNRRPNSREDWLDVQARALFQAGRFVTEIFRS